MSGGSRDPRASVSVQSVDVHRGECITIWLDRSDDPRKRDAVQVELRVLLDGGVEIYSRTSDVTLLDFAEWYLPKSKSEQP